MRAGLAGERPYCGAEPPREFVLPGFFLDSGGGEDPDAFTYAESRLAGRQSVLQGGGVQGTGTRKETSRITISRRRREALPTCLTR